MAELVREASDLLAVFAWRGVIKGYIICTAITTAELLLWSGRFRLLGGTAQRHVEVQRSTPSVIPTSQQLLLLCSRAGILALPLLSSRTKLFLYVKIFSTFADLQPNLLTALSTRRTYFQMRFMQNVSPETCSFLLKIYQKSAHQSVRPRAHYLLLRYPGIPTTPLMTIFSVDRLTLDNGCDAWA